MESTEETKLQQPNYQAQSVVYGADNGTATAHMQSTTNGSWKAEAVSCWALASEQSILAAMVADEQNRLAEASVLAFGGGLVVVVRVSRWSDLILVVTNDMYIYY